MPYQLNFTKQFVTLMGLSVLPFYGIPLAKKNINQRKTQWKHFYDPQECNISFHKLLWQMTSKT